MSSDSGANVKFTADVTGALTGIKHMQESVETATAGITGNIGSMIKAFEAMGPAALVVGAVGVAFEVLKEVLNFIPECIKATGELTESFRQLSITAGTSIQEFDAYSTAMQLSGGKAEDLNHIVLGMSRGIQSNADVLVRNGIAADQTALKHMTLAEYIAKVVAKMNTYADAQDKDALLKAAFGRGGVQMAAVLEELNNNMQKGIELSLEQAGITEKAVADQLKLKEVKGELARQEQISQGIVSNATIQADIAIQQVKVDLLKAMNQQIQTQKMLNAGIIEYVGHTVEVMDSCGQMSTIVVDDWAAMGEAAKKANKQFAEDMETMRKLNEASQAAADKKAGKEPAHFSGKGGAEAEKGAAKQKLELAKETASEEVKIAADAAELTTKLNKTLYQTDQISFEQMIDVEKMATRDKLAAQIAAHEKALEAAKKDPVEAKRIQNQMADDQRKYDNVIQELDSATAKHRYDVNKAADEMIREIERGNEKQEEEINKLHAANELDFAKTQITSAKLALDQRVSLGAMSAQQELQQRKMVLEQETAAETTALQTELENINLTAVQREGIENKIMALHRKNALEMQKLDNEVAKQGLEKYQQMFRALTSGFGTAISGLIHGTMSWGAALKSVMNSALDSVINLFVQWGLKSAENYAMQLISGAATREAEAAGAAAVYAVNAASSVAAIPMYGWAMAPGVMAEAYASGMSMIGLASAAGGWDQVPADQVAMIHKNEMVLPANLAEGARRVFSDPTGATGGGDVHLHISAMDASSFGTFLKNPSNQSALLSMLSRARRNGRV